MAGNYLQRNQKLIRDIIAAKPKGAKLPGWMDTFIEEFFRHLPHEELDGLSPKELLAVAIEASEFLSSRKSGKPKIRIFTPCKEKDGWASEDMVVEMANDDMPFLVDSVTEELNRRGVKIHQIIHPVLHIDRDKNGALQHVYSYGAAPKGATKESLMHFRIAPLSEQAIESLEAGLDSVLEVVRLAVKDWKPILGKVEETLREIHQARLPFPSVYTEEVIAFLNWLRDNNFVFLGYADIDFHKKGGKPTLDPVEKSMLGVLKSERMAREFAIFPAEAQYFANTDYLVDVTKSKLRSLVHRPVHMDAVAVKRYDSKGKLEGERVFFGLFTSTLYYQSARLIPLIRQKIDTVLERSGFASTGHNNKALMAILEAFPRDELFQTPVDELFDTCMGILALEVKRDVKLFIRKDGFERFVSCIIFVPRERFSTYLREKIQDILIKALGGSVANHYTQISDSHLARLQLIIRAGKDGIPEIDKELLEQQVAAVTYSWEDSLRGILYERLPEKEADALFNRYKDAFPISYIDWFTADATYLDIEEMEGILRSDQVAFDLYESLQDKEGRFQLKIYSRREQLSLSNTLPILEHMGFYAIDQHTYEIMPKAEGTVWVHHFRLEVKGAERPELRAIKAHFEEAIERVWNGEAEDDAFNKLVVTAGLQWREVALLRAYSKYLRQIGSTYSQEFIEAALAKHPRIISAIVQLFYVRFNPALKEKREKKQEELVASIQQELNQVSNMAEDRVLRRYMELTLAMLRTNFFQTIDGKVKPALSFKFRSESVPDLPLPHPYAEIFVYSPRVEAIHLRGGKVARGGLRWSDRHEDFRTEILGLMKAQQTKNAVIVPVGSKGGFVVKRAPAEGGREAFLAEGIACYKTFLSGLLDITDNIVKDKIVPPSDVVRHDEDDPYLVVAADKGTATFSDIANSVSANYGFWLGDAFASGGSAGYDHKKMGITARGGWVSVQRHFREMGIDTQTQDFSVIGIGDMAGDVFGNGLLLSEHIKLVGAFNHIHIFLDPNPDTLASFKERKRLFNLPRSSWMDYKQDLISKGGGIFERSAKSIKLSKEVRELLQVSADALTPDELIKAMLKAPVDLLWNGGIGTYVKASDETHADAGDKNNDALRINGKELRCKVIGEGGNLGFTQRGRIEYCLNGGRMNTDFIDNSAGVDCSDHEVNIKIALEKAMASKKLTLKTRNTLLEKMTDEVGELVIRDNYLQTQAISISETRGVELLEAQAQLMRRLEQEKRLDRKIEFLPDEEALARRHAIGKGLTRPELAVLLAYSKLSIYEDLLHSNLPDEPYFSSDLEMYFPKEMQQKFAKEIAGHPLRREIIATFVTNSMVNRVDSTFFHHVKDETGMQGCNIARAYAITREIFELRGLWYEIESLDGTVPAAVQAELFLEAQRLVERVTAWFLRNLPQPLDVTATVEAFADGIKEVSHHLDAILADASRGLLNERFTRLREKGVPETLAKRAAGLELLASACDIVSVSIESELPVHVVGKIYFELGQRLNLGWMRTSINSLHAASYWERLSQKTLVDTLYDEQMRLTDSVVQSKCMDLKSCEGSLANWSKKLGKELERYDAFITSLRTSERPDFPMLVVASKRVESLDTV